MLIEKLSDVVEQYARSRLRMVVAGEDQGGISSTRDWRGGGSFDLFEVSESVYQDGTDKPKLAASAFAQQVGADLAAENDLEPTANPPFYGEGASALLAVVDGTISLDVASMILDGASSASKLLVFGRSVDPRARRRIKSTKPDSTVQKIPRRYEARAPRLAGAARVG